MSDKPEPLSAILAEMRADADNGRCYRRYRIERLADRIEAAAERERENTIYAGRDGEMTLDECITRCDNNSGDNPRGRDVAQIGGWLRELRERRRTPGNAAAMREALNRVEHFANDLRNITERDTEVRADANEIVDVCRAALATPARNCDRFSTAEEARAAFEAAHSHGIVHNLYTAAFDWLFAKAEGGDHA